MNIRLLGIVGLAVVSLFTGCQSIPPGAERGPHGTMAYDVLIDASPPGAVVEANGQRLGNTPVHLKIFGDPDGTFHDFGAYTYVIRALPLTTNQFVQTRVFRTGHMMSPEDLIPNHINFDMSQNTPAYGPPPPYGYPAYGPPPDYYGPPYYYGPSFRFYYGPRYHRRHW